VPQRTSAMPAACTKTVTMPPSMNELALREIYHVGGVVDQREAECHERIDRADRQPETRIAGVPPSLPVSAGSSMAISRTARPDLHHPKGAEIQPM